MEGGEVVVLSRDTRGSGGIGVENLFIDPLQGVYIALDHRDAIVKDVMDVGASLGATKLVEVGDRVVVRVGRVILGPVTLDDGVGVFFIALGVWGIFYHHNMTEQCATSGRWGYRERGRFREGTREDRGGWERGEGIKYIGGEDVGEAANSSSPGLKVGKGAIAGLSIGLDEAVDIHGVNVVEEGPIF